MHFAISVRPEPIRPETPRISPCRSSKLRFSNSCARDRPSTLRTTGRSSGTAAARLAQRGDRPAGHHRHHVLAAGGLRRELAGERTVAQAGDLVGEHLHLVEAVRDVEGGAAIGAHPVDVGVELLRLAVGQRRGRLVEDQDARLGGGGAGDLHQLLLRLGQARDLGARVDRIVDEVQVPGRLGAGGGPVDRDAAADLGAEEDVLGDGELGDEVDLLRSDGDAGGLRLLRAREADRLAVEAELARGRAEAAAEDVHQRRLAGAVLADDRVHRAGAELERDPAQRVHGAERLGDVQGLEDRLHRCTPRRWGGVAADPAWQERQPFLQSSLVMKREPVL